MKEYLPCLTLRFLSFSRSRETRWSANLFSSEGCQSKDIDRAFDWEPPLMAQHVNVIEPGSTMEPHGRLWRLNLWEGGATSALPHISFLVSPPATVQGGGKDEKKRKTRSGVRRINHREPSISGNGYAWSGVNQTCCFSLDSQR